MSSVRLAVKGKALGRRALNEVASIVTPETILRWHRHRVAPTTIANILRRNGREPAPERHKHASWRTFLRSHWESIAATASLPLYIRKLQQVPGRG